MKPPAPPGQTSLWGRLRAALTPAARRAPPPEPRRELVALPHGPTMVEWRRSRRARRVSLRIDLAAGGVVVTLPMRAAHGAGLALLMDHAHWVAERLEALPRAVTFADGAAIPLHGETVVIRHVGGRATARLEDGALLVGGDPAFLARRVEDFLKAEARRTLSAMALAKAATAGVAPKRVSVKDTRTRWGSCAADRSLAFSWRLLMAPAFVQDYVVAHEVAHLRHMNHGPAFWDLVRALTPHTDAATAWLRTEGPALLRVGQRDHENLDSV